MHAQRTTRRFFRLADVKHQTGLGRSAIYAAIKAGKFPAPYQLAEDGRAVGWLSTEIDAYIESRIQATRGAK